MVALVLVSKLCSYKERGKRRKMVKLRVGRRVVGGGTRHLNKLNNAQVHE